MGIDGNTKAAIKAATFENVAFSVSAKTVKRKIGIIATYGPGKTEVAPNVPVRVFSAEAAGAQFEFGFMAHRLAYQSFLAGQGIETWIIPQEEDGGAVAAAGSVDFDGSTGVVAGKMNFYAAAILAQVSLIAAETPQNIALKLIAAITDDENLPVTAVIDGVIDTKVNFTSKTKEASWSDDITLAFNIKPGEALPAGVVYAIVDMTGGSGTPDVQDALDAMGIGDQQNEMFFTDIVCGYGADTSTLDKISAYNGLPNAKTGNYKGETGRPFRALYGDVQTGTAGLNALIAAADLRVETDATNGVLAVPGSYHHPMELAANAVGVEARIQNVRAQQNVVDQIMPGIIPAPKEDRWTDTFDPNRDLAVKKGISPTMVKNNTVVLQNMMTFFRPAALPIDNNVFRSRRNIAITQNIWNDLTIVFALEKWKGFTVVEDTADVTDIVDQEKARDIGDVLDTLLERVEEYRGKSWIYNSDFTVSELQKGDKVTVREDGSGFDYILPLIYSGEGGIVNGRVQVDVSLSVTTA